MKPFDLCDALGAVIASYRVSLGLTQTELARRAGLHPMTISKIERGARVQLDVFTLRALARALRDAGASDVGIASLLDRAEEWTERLAADPELAEHAEKTSILVAIQNASLNPKK